MVVNFFFARHKLNLFKIRLKAYAIDLDNAQNMHFGSAKACEFGQWMNDFQKEHTTNSILMDQLTRSHEMMHQSADRVKQLKQQNETQMWEELDKFNEEFERLNNLLDTIEHEFNQVTSS